MKILICLFALVLCTCLVAQDHKPQLPRHGQEPPILKLADKNQDNKVTKEEWSNLFFLLDENGDGSISKEEFMHQMRKNLDKREGNGSEEKEHWKEGSQKDSRQAKMERFKKMDRNQNKKIEREEWDGKPEMFDLIDANHDDALTVEELKNFKKESRPEKKQPKDKSKEKN